MQNLTKLRKEIDQIDNKISILLKKRADVVLKIKEIKSLYNCEIRDPAREAEIVKRFTTKYEKEVFRKIIEESRKIQDPSLT